MSIKLAKASSAEPNSWRPSLEFLKADFNLRGASLSDSSKESLYRELQALFEANIDVGTSLALLVELTTNKGLVRSLKSLQSSVAQGTALSDSMRKVSVFSSYEVSVVRIGEESGELARVFSQLAAHYNDKLKLKRTIRQALAYPAFVFVISTLVIVFMLNVVVPMFADVFARSGAELPKLTQFVMRISESFQTIFITTAVFVAVLLLLMRFLMQNDDFKMKVEYLFFKVPFFGIIRRKSLLAGMCQSLDLLISSGAQLDRALDMTKEMGQSIILRKALGDVNASLMQGNNLESALREHAIFDKGFIAKVAVAERVNQLDKNFSAMSKRYMTEVEHKTAMLGSVIEPITILFISIFVGIVLVAMYLPMFKLSTSF